MNVTEFLEKWGRTVFESPLARAAHPDSPPELAEIRFAILDAGAPQVLSRRRAARCFPSTWSA